MGAEAKTVLQLCPVLEYLETELAERFRLVRAFGLMGGAPAPNGLRLEDVWGVVTGGHLGCSAALMHRLPGLKIIAINGVGFDKVDLVAARARGVRVSNTPDVLTEDVADLAVGLVVGLLRGLARADAYIRAGCWGDGDLPPARKVSGRRFGIVGLGRIGRAIGARLAPFGPVAYTGLRPKESAYAFHGDVSSLARAVDVLVLACPSTAETFHLVGADVLNALGPDGYLVNVARGAVVDEAALAAALNAGRIAGAALDVFEDEPRVPEALRASARTLLTPHIASATVETRRAMADLVLANLDALSLGKAPPTAVA